VDRNGTKFEETGMQIRVLIAAMALLATTAVWADYDAAGEAREQAQREAAQKAEREKQRQVEKMKSDANAKYNKEVMDNKRKTLGAAAQGKSDAEVDKLYDAKIRKESATAYKEADAAKAALSTGQGAAAMKSTTGKSMKEMQNMSEAELEAWSKEMEKKYVK
jgi:hypothetical protein